MREKMQQLRQDLRKMRFDHRRRRRITKATNDLFDTAKVARLPFKIHNSQEPQTPTDVILRKRGGQIDALINQSWGWMPHITLTDKIAPYIYWFNATSDDVQEIIVNASDGNLPSLADYKFSATSSKFTLLPDAYFFRDHGYIETEQFAQNHAVPWDDRSDDIVWRGRPNGTGLFTVEDETAEKTGVMQRLQMAKKCARLDVDFRFIPDPTKTTHMVLEDAGLIGDYVPTNDWGGKKYAIDIDGFTSAWCNFMQRLKLGCCVLKVDSQFGFRQWYYHEIQPWEHYVPIRADLADLDEQIDWVRSNPAKAREIAANGQAFARTLTFQSETKFAAQAIENREGSR